MLYKRGGLGREDCLRQKVASSKLLVSSAVSLLCTTDTSRTFCACRFLGSVFGDPKMERFGSLSKDCLDFGVVGEEVLDYLFFVDA
jgi:hypothetical protein